MLLLSLREVAWPFALRAVDCLVVFVGNRTILVAEKAHVFVPASRVGTVWLGIAVPFLENDVRLTSPIHGVAAWSQVAVF